MEKPIPVFAPAVSFGPGGGVPSRAVSTQGEKILRIEIARMDLKKGDVIVVRLPNVDASEMLPAIKYFRSIFSKDVELIVLTGNDDLKIMSRDDIDSLINAGKDKVQN